MADAEKAIEVELDKMKNNLVSEQELMKVTNKTESTIAFEDMSVMSRAASIAYYELLGNVDLMNQELEKYSEVTIEGIKIYSNTIFKETNSNTLCYYSKN